MSKSAKKRAARAARQAAEAQEKKALESTANGKSSTNDNTAQADAYAKPTSQPAPVAAVKTEIKAASPGTTTEDAPASAAASSEVDQTPVAASARSDAKAAPSKQASSPPTSSFKPDLPADLPTRTAEELPTNRKRKTPVDFSPSGPGSALTPTSPSKNSVKFEDGIIPGEGVEGEKTIASREKPAAEILAPAAPPKKQNFIERTVWTFIMIFGFIGTSMLFVVAHPQVCCAWVTLT